MKKYIAEFIGAAVLVTFGCGTVVGCDAANLGLAIFAGGVALSQVWIFIVGPP